MVNSTFDRGTKRPVRELEVAVSKMWRELRQTTTAIIPIRNSILMRTTFRTELDLNISMLKCSNVAFNSWACISMYKLVVNVKFCFKTHVSLVSILGLNTRRSVMVVRNRRIHVSFVGQHFTASLIASSVYFPQQLAHLGYFNPRIPRCRSARVVVDVQQLLLQ